MTDEQAVNIAKLNDRGVINVAGADARVMLQGIITNDLDTLADDGAIHAGLLTPQGKILFSFFVICSGNALLIETSRGQIDPLMKRLAMYRLRADVTFEDISERYSVAAAWPTLPQRDGAIVFQDPRLAALGWRVLVENGDSEALSGGWLINGQVHQVDEGAYHAHRIACGVPEAERDYKLGDSYPHEALFDQLAGVSFSKGCYVGQEVVSRMQHRGKIRKRIVPVLADGPLEADVEIVAGSSVIGRIGSVNDNHGLALVRLDRAAEAIGKGLSCVAGPVSLRFLKPNWADFDVPQAP